MLNSISIQAEMGKLLGRYADGSMVRTIEEAKRGIGAKSVLPITSIIHLFDKIANKVFYRWGLDLFSPELVAFVSNVCF